MKEGINHSENSLSSFRRVYFMGIGGIGMSALARYFLSVKVEVYGYDRQRTILTSELENEGAIVHYEDRSDAIPADIDAVIYTPAIAETFGELQFVRSKGIPLYKRSDILGMLTRSFYNICVSGTHGKTTISTFIAYMLQIAQKDAMCILGGISINTGTNFIPGSAQSIRVTEADEYDRSFLKLTPDIAVVNAMDPDHLDIYGTAQAMEDAFISFSENIKKAGWLLYKAGIPRSDELKADHRISYSVDSRKIQADVCADNIRIDQEEKAYVFDVVASDWKICDLKLHIGGIYNIENLLPAIICAKILNLSDLQIRKAVSGFLGVKRRFEYHYRHGDHVLIDDYAHHPQELSALLDGVRDLYPSVKCTVIFQPHLFTRTRDFVDGFATALDKADEIVLLPIYPAREKPIAGICSQLIAEKMHKDVMVIEKENLLKWVEDHNPNLLVMAGAGNISELVDPVKKLLEKLNG